MLLRLLPTLVLGVTRVRHPLSPVAAEGPAPALYRAGPEDIAPWRRPKGRRR